jgi:hypothetical protein
MVILIHSQQDTALKPSPALHWSNRHVTVSKQDYFSNICCPYHMSIAAQNSSLDVSIGLDILRVSGEVPTVIGRMSSNKIYPTVELALGDEPRWKVWKESIWTIDSGRKEIRSHVVNGFD